MSNNKNKGVKNENKENKNKKIKNDETIMYKPIKPFKQKKQKKSKEEKKKSHRKLKLTLKIIFIMILLMAVICGGILFAIVYRCIWGDWAIDEKDLVIRYENSTMFDKDGNAVAVLAGNETREIISKEEMSPYFFKAFIAIEDERFEEHHGVDWKRTLGAFVTFITHSGESSFGGSTLTQQVVKNLTSERDDSGVNGALRKIKEIVRAYEVENILSKEEIITLYLNLVPFGGRGTTICGVQMASKYYFNKDAKDVTLVEAAYIAGITSAPNAYNPFDENTDRTEKINNKVKTVLRKMYELGKISEEEYNQGLAEVEAGIKFSKGEVSQNKKLSYYLEATMKEVKEDLMKKNGWSADEAEVHIFGDGYQIYTNLDQSIQTEVDKQFVDNAKNWYVVKKVNRTDSNTGEKTTIQVQRQGAMVIIDNATGYVVAGSGGLGEKTVANRIK